MVQGRPQQAFSRNNLLAGNKYCETERDACGVGFVYRPYPCHETISDALRALSRLEHRGAVAADGVSGDGAGILTQIPIAILNREGIEFTKTSAVATLFIPQGHEETARETFTQEIQMAGLSLDAWRTVPIRTEALGEIARDSMPHIVHAVFSGLAEETDGSIREKLLHQLRQRIYRSITAHQGMNEFHFPSMSDKTIVYKGMVNSNSLRDFYCDLTDGAFQASWAVFHRRFSTNTISKWSMAQPFRLLGHNGEINTIKGNLNWLHARQLAAQRRNAIEPDSLEQPHPDWAGSDSSILDYAVESLVADSDPIEAALMKLVPEAYEHGRTRELHPEISHFYEYFAGIQEPWDGPALVAFSDGKSLGAVLDRNGLRPARYQVYEDGSIFLGSEAGIDISTDAAVLERGRLKPGQMLSVNLKTGAIRKDREIKGAIAAEHPYGQSLLQHRQIINPHQFNDQASMGNDTLTALQLMNGLGKEDVDAVLAHMALSAGEPVMSMGDDTAIAALSNRPKVLFDYFKQRFAQVTNPPIDSIRERIVMSLETHLGRKPEKLRHAAEGAGTVLLTSPIVNDRELAQLSQSSPDQTAKVLPLTFDLEGSLECALDDLLFEAERMVIDGATILVISDRGRSPQQLVIPALLATSALHHHLINRGLRLDASIVVDTAQCWTSHQVACLLGFGAQAICPYLALETVRHWYLSDKTQAHIHQANNQHQSGEHQLADSKRLSAEREYEGLTIQLVQENYRKSLESGILKILSKMGISKLSSYIGAQIFETLGLSKPLVDRYFPGTSTRIGGLSILEIEAEQRALHQRCFIEGGRLKDEGTFKNRKHGEYHRNNPELVQSLHRAVGLRKDGSGEEQRKEEFENYSTLLSGQQAASVRDLLEIKSDRETINVEEVAAPAEILQRLLTGGMSLGALSKESHEALAIAMNRIGARSNSGEGGEDPIRSKPITPDADGTSKDFPGLINLKEGDSARSKIRQVASGRFGVTTSYLVGADQLEIKVAQGAKPGEGGQLPAHKVSPYIASLRKTRPGIPLISPPPHHDIYSIEDLAQLIHDLRQVNPTAKISVKLVAESGIGTVAAGVAKAGADIIHVSGHDGGTGAAPVTSIKHAGMPWELGLSETHKTLSQFGLRDRVVLRVDGGLKSGEDIVKAAILGADEFAFGTIALLAQGCIMARVCHTNNCPVGIASQKEALRKRFHGDPASVVAFFEFIADEARYLLSQMGYRSLAELRGRTDLLQTKTGQLSGKTAGIDLHQILDGPDDIVTGISIESSVPRKNKGLALKIELDEEIVAAIECNGTVMRRFEIENIDRSIGASLAGRLARKYGDDGFEGQIILHLEGTAGQSFGAFNYKNVRLILEGQANDYVGKGMSGGEIVIRNPIKPRACSMKELDSNRAIAPIDPLDSPGEGVVLEHPNNQNVSRLHGLYPVPGVNEDMVQPENILAGNTCLYGATGGSMFVAGGVGERFAVRNSGAQAVVEGAGDHCCEYMTGGTVVILGQTGRNFGAGMTGGIAYVLDEAGSLLGNLNSDDGKLFSRLQGNAENELRRLIGEHLRHTHSEKARLILDNWEHYVGKFVQIVPPAELESMELVAAESVEQAQEGEAAGSNIA